MIIAQNIIGAILLLTGTFFLIVSSIGIIRLPDFYTRAHAVGKSDTLGLMLTLAGLAVINGFEISTAKLAIIIVFVLVANPTATNVITEAAIHFGLESWRKDRSEDDENEAEES